jgi:hypothetical protein
MMVAERNKDKPAIRKISKGLFCLKAGTGEIRGWVVGLEEV